MRRQTAVTIAIMSAMIIIGSYFLYPQSSQPLEGDKIKVVASFHPLTYFTKEIGGDQVSVKQLIPNNIEVHSWQPSTFDILAIEEADIILYNGAGLDHWIETDIIPAINTHNKIVVETTEGIELRHISESNNHEQTIDPHTWISPLIAKQQAQRIYEALIQEDPTNIEYYYSRWLDLKNRFEDLENNYTTELSTITKQDIFVTHAAYGYLAETYGFEQHGVIGISADEQPSTSTMATLVDMMIDKEVYVVYLDPMYTDEYAQTLKRELESHVSHTIIILKLYLLLGPIDDQNYFQQQAANLENLKIGLEATKNTG